MAEVAQSSGNRNKFRKSSNRLSTRVDMTPMVDLGFLLITFFVFTTTMSTPTTLDIIEPVDGDPATVKESGAMTILLGDSNKVFYYHGLLNEQSEILRADMGSVRKLIVRKKKQTNETDLMYVIKALDGATFGNSISLLDEMAICAISKEHYAEADVSEKELKFIGLADH